MAGLRNVGGFSRLAGLAMAGGLALSASSALADPCEAVTESGPTPQHLRPGATLSGSVVLIIDGDSLCVATGSGEQTWVEVRLADFNAPETSQSAGPAAKAALSRVAFGQEANCVAQGRTYDRIAAICRINGRTIGELLRAADIPQGGNGDTQQSLWAKPAPATLPTQTRRTTTSQRQRVGAYFRSCAAARAAGAAPMMRGEPGFNPNLDRDGDGIACEPLRPR